jgi:transcriptional regulator with XRE-family HTH domain
MFSTAFYGTRLREAREARGYSLQQVADHLGISKQGVSLYEKAMRRPRPDHFQKLVEYLRVPPNYFTRPPLTPHSSPTFYRSMASATKRMRDAAEEKLKWLREIVAFLSRHVELKPLSLPPCDFPADPNKITVESIEEIAAELRRFWGLGGGVISNVVHLLENKGIVVARFPLESEKLDELLSNVVFQAG